MTLIENISRFPSQLPGADHHIQIPDGLYVSDFVGSAGFYYLGRSPRLSICFRISDDVGAERHIFAFYKVLELSCQGRTQERGKRSRNPVFRIGWRSRLARDLGQLFPDLSPSNLPTSIPTIDSPVLIKTATVREDSHGSDRPESFWSSKVERIEGWANDD
jgi:hypothetical protein